MSDGNTEVERAAELDALEPAVDDVQAMHQEALSMFESESNDAPKEPADEDAVVVDGPDDPTPAAEAAEDDDPVDAGPATPEWDGLDPDTVPEGLEPGFKKMLAAHNKRSQAEAETRKALEADRDQLRMVMAELERRNAQPAAPVAADTEPKMPSEPSEAEAVQFWKDHNAWQVRAELANQRQAGAFDDPALEQFKQQQAYQAAVSRSIDLLNKQEGYTAEVDQRMLEVTQGSEFWRRNVATEEGAMELFGLVQKELADKASAEKAEASVRRKSDASKGKVTPPGSKSRARPPSKSLADMSVEDINAEARRISGIS